MPSQLGSNSQTLPAWLDAHRGHFSLIPGDCIKSASRKVENDETNHGEGSRRGRKIQRTRSGENNNFVAQLFSWIVLPRSTASPLLPIRGKNNSRIFGRYADDSTSKLRNGNAVFRESFYSLPSVPGHRDIIQEFPTKRLLHPFYFPFSCPGLVAATSSQFFSFSSSKSVSSLSSFDYSSFSFVPQRSTLDIVLFIHSMLDSYRILRVGTAYLRS